MLKYILLVLLIIPLIFTGVTNAADNECNPADGEYDDVIGEIYYVSPNGRNRDEGTASEPFRTFERAISKLDAGEELQICAGIYDEPLVIPEDVRGNAESPIRIRPVQGHDVVLDMEFGNEQAILVEGDYITIQGLEVRNTDHICVHVLGSHIEFSEMEIHDCNLHGIQFSGSYGAFRNSEVYAASRNNRDASGRGGWQSAVKVAEGEHIIIEQNEIYENYGEGMSIRGGEVLVTGNIVYDNFSMNIYIDNSLNVVVDSNFTYSTGNPNFERDGRRETCIAAAEEYYRGWGSNLINLTVTNNIAAYCYHNFSYWGNDEGVEQAGIKGGLIANNLFWGSTDRGIRIVEAPYTNNVRIYNNIVQQDDNRLVYIEGNSGLSMDYNFWVGSLNETAVVRGLGVNDLSGDIQLAQIPTLDDTNSFRLDVNSPAIDSGFPLTEILTDFNGNLRDNRIDIGPIEYNASP